MMMSFNDLIHKYSLENEGTSNIKIRQILSSLSLSDLGIYLRHGPFKTDIGIVINQKEHIGLYILIRLFLIHMGAHYQTNYLSLL